MKALVIDREAHQEVAQAKAYYEQQREGLGDRFLAVIEEGYDRIERMPRSFSAFRDSRFRKCILKKFPYTIYFEEKEDVIRIVAVAHQRRNEGYWLDRADD